MSITCYRTRGDVIDVIGDVGRLFRGFRLGLEFGFEAFGFFIVSDWVFVDLENFAEGLV